MKRIIIMMSILLATSGAPAADMTAYVINTSGETMDRIDLVSGVVTKNIITLGSDIGCFPNQVVVRDSLAYVLLSGTAEIQIIDIGTETTVGWIDLPGGSNPYWMGFLDDHYLYISLMVANSLAKVDLLSRQVVDTVDVGLSPEGVLLLDGKVYIAITAYDFDTWTWGQGKVAVYDIDLDAVIGEIEVGTNPQFLACDDSGRVHVVCTGDYWEITGAVYFIDPEADTVVDSLTVGGQPGQIAIGPDHVAVLAAGGWSADGEVFSYHSLTGDIYHDASNPLYVDSGATGAVPFQDSTTFVSTFGDRIIRLDAAGEKLATYHMGDGPVHLDFNYRPGDASGDWTVSIADVVYLVNYIFKGGPRPAFPRWRADPNADGRINIGDAVYLVQYIFAGGPGPKIGPIWVR